MAEKEWLLFITQLPATPSSLRVHVWRKLRHAGATGLQNGVWVLPRNAENIVFLERLLGYVRQNEAGGLIFQAEGIHPDVQEEILRRFEADRNQEYKEFLEQCREFISELEKETRDEKFTFAELEEAEQNFQRLHKWIAKIQKRDFLRAEMSQEAVLAFQNCRKRLLRFTSQVYSREGIEMTPEEPDQTDDPSSLPDDPSSLSDDPSSLPLDD